MSVPYYCFLGFLFFPGGRLLLSSGPLSFLSPPPTAFFSPPSVRGRPSLGLPPPNDLGRGLSEPNLGRSPPPWRNRLPPPDCSFLRQGRSPWVVSRDRCLSRGLSRDRCGSFFLTGAFGNFLAISSARFLKSASNWLECASPEK